MAEVNEKNLTGEGLAALWELIKAEGSEVLNVANSKAKIVTGTYTGVGETSKSLTIGFTPKVLIISAEGTESYFRCVMHGLGTFGLAAYVNPSGASGSRVNVTEWGSIVTWAASNGTNTLLNGSGKTYHYCAIG